MARIPRLVAFLLRAVVVVLVYVAIGRTINFSSLALQLTPSLAYAVAGAVGLTLIQATICVYRWMLVAKSTPNVPGFRASFLVYTEGLFINQVLPSVVGGDALRVVRWREYGVSTAAAVASVLGDRVFGVLGAALIALVSVAQLSSLGVDYGWMPLAGVLVGSAVVACVGFFKAATSEWFPRTLGRSDRMSRLAGEISRVDLGRTDFLNCTALSIAGQMLAGIGALLIARSLRVEASALTIVTLTALIVLISMIPISLAGWGVREAGFLAVLVPLGVSAEQALLLGVLFGLQGLLASLIGGVSLLLQLSSPRKGEDRSSANSCD